MLSIDITITGPPGSRKATILEKLIHILYPTLGPTYFMGTGATQSQMMASWDLTEPSDIIKLAETKIET
jgi:hypothetical protein